MMMRCASCGVGFLEPFNTVEYGEGFYAPFITPDSLPWFIRSAVSDGRSFSSESRYREQLRRIRALAPQPLGLRLKLLDIGCGIGDFIHAAAENGIEAWGVESSTYAVDYCKAHHRYPVQAMDEFDALPRDFDIVTLWHVLEHTMDPAAFLATALTRLRPGGLLVIEVPNWGAWIAKVTQARWRHIRREHLFYFTPAALSNLVARSGLRVMDVSYTGSLGVTPYLNKMYRWSGEALKHALLLWPVKVVYRATLSAIRLGDFVRIHATKPDSPLRDERWA